MVDNFIIKEKDSYFPISIYKNYEVELSEIKLREINIENNRLDVIGFFTLSSNSFRFRGFKLWITINDEIKKELNQILHTNILNLENANSKTKQSFEVNILNENYSTTKDNEMDITTEFIFKNIELDDELITIKIEVEYFYNLFSIERVVGYQEFLIEKNWNLIITKFAEDETKSELEEMNLEHKSYFNNNLLENYEIELINNNEEIKLKYDMVNDELKNNELKFNYFYSTELGDIFYEYELGYTLLIKIENNKIYEIEMNNKIIDRRYFFNLYDSLGKIVETNLRLCLCDDIDVKIRKSDWCPFFISNYLENKLCLENLEKYYSCKKVINFGNKTINLKITNLNDICDYEFIANTGEKMGKLEIEYLDYFINIDFSKLTKKNLGINIEIADKFQIVYDMRFYGSGGVGNILISPTNIPCFTKTCYILTPNGYTNITLLKKGDLITTPDNRNVPITNIFVSKISTELEKPYVIRADHYGENKPMLDTYISRKHQYKLNGKWTSPEKEKLKQKWNNNVLVYYHIETPEYMKDNLMVNGIEMESWDGKIPLPFVRNKKKYK